MTLRMLSGDIINFIFPETCQICGKALSRSEKILCLACMNDIPRVRYHLSEENKTAQLFVGRIPFIKASSYFFYTKGSGYAELIHKLKYNGKKKIGRFLGYIFAEELKESGYFDDIDILLPVPLHQKRMRKRGYNQSKEIAEGIAKATNLPIDTSGVIRTVNTATQTRKTKSERFTNVQNIFAAKDIFHLEGKHILLVDDVITTGATLEAIYEAIGQVKDLKISIISLGIAS